MNAIDLVEEMESPTVAGAGSPVLLGTVIAIIVRVL